MDDLKSFVSSANSSPWSNGESRYETPGTALTQPSPAASLSDDKSDRNGAIKQPPLFPLQAISTGVISKEDLVNTSTSGTPDPFTNSSQAVVSEHVLNGPKLSPTAATFVPLHSIDSVDNPSGFMFSSKIHSPSAGIKSGYSATGFDDFNATSIPDSEKSNLHANLPHPSPWTQFDHSHVPLDQTINSKHGDVSATDLSPKKSSFSSTTGISRYLKVANVSRNADIETLNAAFNELSFKIPTLVVISELQQNGILYAQFTDLRDARNAFLELPKSQLDWDIKFVSAREFMMVLNPGQMPEVSDFEGQLIVSAHCEGPRQFPEINEITSLVRDLLQTFGELLTYEIPFASFPTIVIRAEFFDSAEAEKALRLDGIKLAGVKLSVAPCVADRPVRPTVTKKTRAPVIVGQNDDEINDLMGNMGLREHFDKGAPNPRSLKNTLGLASCVEDSGYYYAPEAEAFGCRSYSNTAVAAEPGGYSLREKPHFPWQPYNLGLGAIGQERIDPFNPRSRCIQVAHQHNGHFKRGNRQNDNHTSVHHNVVDIDRICQGLDVRTTIMLRNIPNKIDQSMLKEIVDDTSYGKYDFMYLRIDFANNCNVGYAFINFEDPWFIIDFVKARAGRRWNRFNSDKVAEVSYATIQGKDCLVQKFRNSSVMLEHSSFRPKIFHTGTGPQGGREDTFPEPDNPSKMRRSVENAEHVGLFAPRAGQHFRDEQRRRRSQYDRGTRQAEIEDSYASKDFQLQPPSHGRRLENTAESFLPNPARLSY